jgi:hypothetical protein
MTKPEIAGEAAGIQGVIINDCYDSNARARQTVRFESLFGVTPAFIDLEGQEPDLQAAGQLIDVLDTAITPGNFPQGRLITLLNVAPRGDDIRGRWANGPPFCYFETDDKNIIFSTYEGRSLSLVRDLGIVSNVELLDIPTITDGWTSEGLIDEEEATRINDTQFRSNDFLPLAAWAKSNGYQLSSETRPLKNHPSVSGNVWMVDNFGNAKTTLLPGDVNFEDGKVLRTGGHELICHSRLADVPTGEPALTIGSSGYGRNRFLEVVIQKGNAAAELGLKVGSNVLSLLQQEQPLAA